MNVEVRYEIERGCGMRKVGGVYLVSPPEGLKCGRFPIPVHTCPTCSAGIKPSRGWTWVDGDAIKDTAKPCRYMVDNLDAMLTDSVVLGFNPALHVPCSSCIMSPLQEMGRAGLIWIGANFYPTPEDFLREGSVMGFSRRLPGGRVPRGFRAGETWVLFGHRLAIAPWQRVQEDQDDEMTPGIIAAWKPSAIEVVVPEDYDEEEVERKIKRGLTPVIVRHAQLEHPEIPRPIEGDE
jgi:hypothetical protein